MYLSRWYFIDAVFPTKLSFLPHFRIISSSMRPFTLTESYYYLYFVENWIPVYYRQRCFLSFYSAATLARLKRCRPMLRQIRPFLHPSVTLRYRVKTRECRGMRSSPSGSAVSRVVWCQAWLMRTTLSTVQLKFDCKEVDPCENSRIVHILPHNSGTIIDSEKNSINCE